MSYILDALRKAERDRNVGRVPTLADVTQMDSEPSPPARSRRVLVFGAVVVVVLAVIAAYFVFDRSHEPPAGDAAEVNAAPADDTTTEAPAVPEEEPDMGDAETSPALDPESDPSSLDELMDTEAEPGPDTDMDTEPEADEGAASEPQMAEPEEEEFFEVTDEPPSAAVGAASPATATPAPAVMDRVTPLREMPADYRSAFPVLRVDVHVHDADAARRWVLINGRKYLEGATLAEGPRIVQITAEGIVFDFRGKAVLLPLNR
ncbi:MAG: general secretion pathway protein GspB [Panacagrimonas sp.]